MAKSNKFTSIMRLSGFSLNQVRQAMADIEKSFQATNNSMTVLTAKMMQMWASFLQGHSAKLIADIIRKEVGDPDDPWARLLDDYSDSDACNLMFYCLSPNSEVSEYRVTLAGFGYPHQIISKSTTSYLDAVKALPWREEILTERGLALD